MQALTGGPSTPIEQVSELGDGIIQKLVTAGITTVEALADMTPEQLEEIPGIGEKTLEKISIAVRNYFSSFEEGEAVESAEAGTPEGEAEETAATEEEREAVLATDEAEAESASEVIEEAEEVTAAETDSEPLSAAEFAIENVPDADDSQETEASEIDEERTTKEDDA
jgi:N utilization substance protein A